MATIPPTLRPARAAAARPSGCIAATMGLGKAIVAGVGAKMLTGSLLGFLVVFALIYWLL